MKIRFATFAIAKYGGIVAHIEAKFKALQDLGHDVDIIILDYVNSIPENQYDKKLEKLESGDFQDSLEIKSQNGGYAKSEITGYWFNSYYGWLLKPNTNRIACLNEETGLDYWNKALEGVDLIIWSFVPTKTSEAKGFNWWHRYFEIPESIKQVLTIHDGYYDMRNSWTNLLKSKIKFFECVHITSYEACKVFDIPRLLNLDSRYIDDENTTPFLGMEERSVDFFAAHIFKSMKRMEDLVSAVPYLFKATTMVAGSGIELYYMMTDNVEKQKPKYTVSVKTDPDCLKKDVGKSLWTRAEEHGMEYLGLISNEEVNFLLRNSKFAIDPSFSTHYAKFVNTHLNGFIIEAIINGCYPVLRNYRKDVVEEDFIFRDLKAIYIPYDSTPAEFGEYLNKAKEMCPKKFKKDIRHNFELAKDLLNPNLNMQLLLEVVNAQSLIKQLEVGKSTKKIQDEAVKIMTSHFKYDEMPHWMSD